MGLSRPFDNMLGGAGRKEVGRDGEMRGNPPSSFLSFDRFITAA